MHSPTSFSAESRPTRHTGNGSASRHSSVQWRRWFVEGGG